MGLLVNGEWKDQWYDTKASNGRFVREDSSFRQQVVAAPGHRDDFKAEPDRYHLFVSYACPWAHRTLIFRKLKKLEDLIGVTVVSPYMMENGWEFEINDPSLKALDLDVSYLHQIYTDTNPTYTGRVTVPVLWDKKNRIIVNNESAEIIRIFNSAFNEFTSVSHDFYPQELRDEIDAINDKVYHHVNNGVYKSGFATTQSAYEEAFDTLFETLEMLDSRLSQQRFLVGNRLTEADWRLFTTLVRFDAVYFSHFKTNLKRIADYEHLSHYLRELYQIPGVKETVHMDHIKQHYYYSHQMINPTRIVPKGPELNLSDPHNRDRFGNEPLIME